MINANMTIKAISPKDLLIYLCLRRYKNSTTGESSVSISKLTEQTGASPVTVLNSIERLKETGHIKCEKKGRANSYKFLSDIEATSYAFLDEDLSYSDKANEAVKVAIIRDSANSAPSNGETGRLYDYMVKIEEDVVRLKGQIRILTAELDKVRRCTTVITGQEYYPITFPDKP